jgi:hypothetical protein
MILLPLLLLSPFHHQHHHLLRYQNHVACHSFMLLKVPFSLRLYAVICNFPFFIRVAVVAAECQNQLTFQDGCNYERRKTNLTW